MSDNLIEPHAGSLSDQIVKHGLQGKPPDAVVPQIVIELRRLREDLARQHNELMDRFNRIQFRENPDG